MEWKYSENQKLTMATRFDCPVSRFVTKLVLVSELLIILPGLKLE